MNIHFYTTFIITGLCSITTASIAAGIFVFHNDRINITGKLLFFGYLIAIITIAITISAITFNHTHNVL